MVAVQAGACTLLGTGLGVGLCAAAGLWAHGAGVPFRMLWFTPLAGGGLVGLATTIGAAASVGPILRVQPVAALSGR